MLPNQNANFMFRCNWENMDTSGVIRTWKTVEFEYVWAANYLGDKINEEVLDHVIIFT